MLRYLPGATLARALILQLAASADAQKEICTVTSDIVAAIVTLRAEGRQPDVIKRSLTSDGVDIAEDYKPTVPPLVDMVFTLDEAVVQDPAAAQVISDDYRNSCLGYEP